MAKEGKSQKRSDKKRPARMRYTSEKKLMKHKVRNLVRYNNMSKKAAEEIWKMTRVRGNRS